MLMSFTRTMMQDVLLHCAPSTAMALEQLNGAIHSQTAELHT